MSYGGDEVSALVLDVGHNWTRAGFAGDDLPKAVFPSFVGHIPAAGGGADANTVGASDAMEIDNASGIEPSNVSASASTAEKWFVGDNEIYMWRDKQEIKTALADGMVSDWSVFEKLVDHALNVRLRAASSEHPLLISESTFSSRDVRERLTEIAFEKYGVPAAFLARSAVLSAFATGRSNALVVDSGGDTTVVAPVYDGYVIKKSIVKQQIAGNFLSNQAVKILETKFNLPVNPHYLIGKKRLGLQGKPSDFVRVDRKGVTTDSFHSNMVQRVADDFKESVCQVAESTYNEQALQTRQTRTYEFPDGTHSIFGMERFRIPEIMFNPKKHAIDPPSSDAVTTLPSGSSIGESVRGQLLGIQEMVHQAISACDVDIRPTLLSNIVLTGGNTLFPGFTDRLSLEVATMMPSSKIKVFTMPMAADRKFSAWIGGSILASLGSFQQMWMSRQEYDEIGRSLVEKRCL